MGVPVGGRGNKAPYGTTHMRVPVPIKEILEQLVEKYKQAVVEGQEVNLELNSTNVLSLEQATEKAKQILAQKKSAKLSLKNLLTAIYGVEIEL